MIGHGGISLFKQLTTTHPLGEYSVVTLSFVCGIIAIVVSVIVFYLYQVHSSSSFITAFSILFITTLIMAVVMFIAFIDTYSVRSLIKENASKMMALEYEVCLFGATESTHLAV